jgi:hypothetical protein
VSGFLTALNKVTTTAKMVDYRDGTLPGLRYDHCYAHRIAGGGRPAPLRHRPRAAVVVSGTQGG